MTWCETIIGPKDFVPKAYNFLKIGRKHRLDDGNKVLKFKIIWLGGNPVMLSRSLRLGKLKRLEKKQSGLDWLLYAEEERSCKGSIKKVFGIKNLLMK